MSTKLKEKQEQQTVVRKDWLHKFADWLNDWHITRIFQALGSFLLVLTLIGFFIDYQNRQEEREARQEERIARQYDREISAWQLLAIKMPGNTGKVEALEYLVRLGKKLEGLDLSGGAFLEEAKLANGHFFKTDFSEALLGRANFTGSYLIGADFTNADLSFVRFDDAKASAIFDNSKLRGAVFSGADLSLASFKNADLGFEKIHSGLEKLHKEYNESKEVMTEYQKSQLAKNITILDTISNRPDIVTDFRKAKNLDCSQLKESMGWENTYRDSELACGADIPTPPSSD